MEEFRRGSDAGSLDDEGIVNASGPASEPPPTGEETTFDSDTGSGPASDSELQIGRYKDIEAKERIAMQLKGLTNRVDSVCQSISVVLCFRIGLFL